MNSIAVIGAGPAGLMAAISAAEYAAQRSAAIGITVFEKNFRPGKKLLITGSGQCNITNLGDENYDPQAFLSHYGTREQTRFLRNAYYACTNSDICERFASWGVPLLTRPDGKVFPRSLRAEDILQALVTRCHASGITIRTGFPVDALEREKSGTLFTIFLSDGTSYSFSSVIIAAGGMSYPATGSTGDGYQLAQGLGHTLVPPHPALCGITVASHPLKALSGISFPACAMEIRRKGARAGKYTGELLITHTGFSGPLVINHSREIRTGDSLLLDFSGQGAGSLFAETLKRAAAVQGGRNIENLLHGTGIPHRLARMAIKAEGLDGSRNSSEIPGKKLTALADRLTRWEHTVSSAGSFFSAMATAGGVSLKEVDPASMQSRLLPGLFFAGEVLDVDGETGGYNLQAAFSTGAAAGQSALMLLLNFLDH